MVQLLLQKKQQESLNHDHCTSHLFLGSSSRFSIIIVIGLMLCGVELYQPNSLMQSWITLSSSSTRYLNTMIGGTLQTANNDNTQGGSPPPPPPLSQVADMMMMPEYPTNLRVLVAIPMYDLRQYQFFERLLDSLVDVCFCDQMQTLHIVIYTTTVMPIPTLQEIEDRTAGCQKQLNFTLSIKLRSPSIEIYLVDEHRALFYEQIDNYDLFVYNEEDNYIGAKHIFGYWRETAILQNRLPSDQFQDYSIGFVRFEAQSERCICEFSWDTRSPEDFAEKHIISRLIPFTGSYYFNAGYSFHQGMYMATATQLRKWKERGPSCHFNDTTRIVEGWHFHREKVSSLHLYNPQGCNVTQLIPADRYQDFLVHHMPNSYCFGARPFFRKRSIPITKLGSMLAASINFLNNNKDKNKTDEEEQSNSPALSKPVVHEGTVGSSSVPPKKWINIEKPEGFMHVELNETAYSAYLHHQQLQSLQ